MAEAFRMTEDKIVSLAQEDPHQRRAEYEQHVAEEVKLAAHEARWAAVEERSRKLAEDPRPRAAIEATIDRLRLETQELKYDALERAHFAEKDGLVLGDKPNQLSTQGAPKLHPVWSDELRYETRVLRQQGEIGHELRPWEQDPVNWPTQFELGVGQKPPPEHELRRADLSLEQRRQEHEARWAVIEQKLAAWSERVTGHIQSALPERARTHSQAWERER